MRYLSGWLFHQKKFPVKFIGHNLFFPWLLVFYYLTDAFVLVLFTSSTSRPHPLCRSSRSQMFYFRTAALLKRYSSTGVFLCKILCYFSWMFFLLLLHCHTYTLQYCYFLRLKKHFSLYITTTTSLMSQ